MNLHGRGPQSTVRLLATRPRCLIAFGYPLPPHVPPPRVVEWRNEEHDAQRWCRLLASVGIVANPDDRALPRPAAVSGGRGRTVVVHPGAGAPARRWPAERFAAIVEHLLDVGRDVVVTGTRCERRLCQRVVDAVDRRPGSRLINMAGRTTVLELAATIAGASLVVSNDTGVAHLASAYRTPSVVLFGPTPPLEWGPPAGGPHIALWSGQRGDPHGRQLDPGLASLGVDVVKGAIETLDQSPG